MSRFDGHVRDLGAVERSLVAALAAKIAASPDIWSSGDPRFRARLDDVRNLVLRFPDDYPRSHAPASYTAAWDGWAPLVGPVVAGLAASCGYARWGAAKIVLSNLRPGGTVPRHVDENPSSQVPHKIHVPLATHPDAVFLVEDAAYHLAAGRGWEVNNLLPHAAENRSPVDRVHLIVEIFPTEDVGATSPPA